jgi:hypothetical protein
MGSLASAISHAVATALHPLENVKLRFQANDSATNNPIPRYRGIADAITTVYKTEGLKALYRGAGV